MKELSDDSNPLPISLPAKDPDFEEQSQVVSVIPCLNPDSRKRWDINKWLWLFLAIKYWGDF